MATVMTMCRHDLITKEMMEAYPKGKESIQHSVHDDLDYFVEKLQYERSKYKPKGKLRYYESIRSYFLPKSTAKEKQLVETKNTEFMDTLMEKNPNKILQNMKKSESKSMYVRGICWRQTFHIDASSTSDSAMIQQLFSLV